VNCRRLSESGCAGPRSACDIRNKAHQRAEADQDQSPVQSGLRERMTVAAKQARLLQDVSGPAAAELVPIVASQAAFMAEVASVIETPWNMSTGPDLAFPSTRGSRHKGAASCFATDLSDGTASSNPLSSSGESNANLTHGHDRRCLSPGATAALRTRRWGMLKPWIVCGLGRPAARYVAIDPDFRRIADIYR
jgi:hypothetical protein